MREIGAGAGPLSETRRPLPLALATSMRPRQWTKNALLLAPLVFARRATDPASVRLAPPTWRTTSPTVTATGCIR